jgi:hypothetical protein
LLAQCGQIATNAAKILCTREAAKTARDLLLHLDHTQIALGEVVLSLRRYNHLKDHGARLRERGFLSATEAAHAYGVSPETIRNWGRTGCIPMYHADGRGIMLFPPPGEHPHHKYERQFQPTR